MREHLYQGKRLDNGEWIEGYYCRANCFLGQWGEWHLIAIKDDDLIVPVDPETVSEFTGLPDKNGKRIFEGIIRQLRTREDIALVEYDSKTGGYRLKVYNNGKYKRISKFTKNHLWAYNAEVVGNKWDNPELLEG